MLKKIFYLVTIFAALLFFGCNEQSVSPLNSGSNKVSGKTKLVKFLDLGSTTQLENGNKQILNQIAVFEDVCNCPQLTGTRKIVMNQNLNKDNCGSCFGTFSIEAKNAYWEGEWTGNTNALGTTIKAVGYNLNERDQRGEWEYYFPSGQNGELGTYSAQIYFDKN